MKEYALTELGYFTESECKALKQKLDGKTIMNFTISWSSFAGNCTLILKTDYEDKENYQDAEEDIKNSFMHYVLSAYALS